VQVEAIPMALQGQDILCQAKSGMGKTAVFVISILNQITTTDDNYEPHQAIITCHTRELAHQIFKDFKRLGTPVETQAAISKNQSCDSAATSEESPWRITKRS
jgi:superfamily II DNA/RNA helicase